MTEISIENKKDTVGFLVKKVSAAPLAFFRIAFGMIMCISMIRFMLKGWVDTLYVQPKYYFPFYGFEWVKPFGEWGMYLAFILLILSALFIGLGFLYRYSAWLFFLLFTYVELIDKSNYLNHYYFISIVAFLLCLVPAGKSYSLDVKFSWTKSQVGIPYWCIFIFKIQLAIVYFYAGIAKINEDWLLNAMPLKIWLPAKYDLPIIGSWLDEVWIAYFFSWAGMLYDVCIPFLLFWRRTSYLAIVLVIIFHVLTSIFFPMIGMFPFIMLMAALIFLPSAFHERLLSKLGQLFPKGTIDKEVDKNHFSFRTKALYTVLIIHFFIQISVPLRYLFYPGELFWTEEGYRFSWRVMLMEKAGYTTFTILDKKSGKIVEVSNLNYLSKQQEKMMSTQPDMILQYAKILERDHKRKGMKNPEVYVESYATLNGRPSRLYIDSSIDLTKQEESFMHKTWILSSN